MERNGKEHYTLDISLKIALPINMSYFAAFANGLKRFPISMTRLIIRTWQCKMQNMTPCMHIAQRTHTHTYSLYIAHCTAKSVNVHINSNLQTAQRVERQTIFYASQTIEALQVKLLTLSHAKCFKITGLFISIAHNNKIIIVTSDHVQLIVAIKLNF